MVSLSKLRTALCGFNGSFGQWAKAPEGQNGMKEGGMENKEEEEEQKLAWRREGGDN